MAVNETVGFLQFIKEALVHKARFPHSIDYPYRGNPIRYDPRIYSWTKGVFEKRGLRDYLKIEDPQVLEKLVKNLAEDERLRFLNHPETADPLLLPPQFHQKIEQEVIQERAIYTESAHAPFTETPINPAPSAPLMHPISHAPISTPQTPTQPQIDAPNIPNSPNFPDFPKQPFHSAGLVFQKYVGRNLRLDSLLGGLSKVVGFAGKGVTGILDTIGGTGRSPGPRFPGGRAGRFLLRGANIGGSFLSGLSGTTSRPSSPFMIRGRVWAGAAVGALFLFIFGASLLSLVVPSSQQTNPTVQAAPLSSGVSVSSCQFTRAGVAKPVKSAKLMSIIQEVSAKTGVPAAVLASVAMHESEDFTANALDDHAAFGSSGITMPTGCSSFGLTDRGSSPTGALGIMQVQPPKKIHDLVVSSGKVPPFEQVGAYSEAGVKTGANFVGKTVDDLTLQDFCDLKTSVYLGAGVLIAKNGGKPPATSDEVKTAVCNYFGSPCTYGSFNYGLEAQKDFDNCQVALAGSPAAPGAIGFSLSCPLAGDFSISCGTGANPVNNCGHGGIGYATKCDPTYYVCAGDKYSEALYHAIDIVGSSQASMPFGNGNEVIEWNRVEDQPIAIGGGAWGYRLDYTATFKGHKLSLDLTHLNPQINPAKVLRSGEIAGTVFAGIGHLHSGIAVDDKWVEPIQDVRMCAK